MPDDPRDPSRRPTPSTESANRGSAPAGAEDLSAADLFTALAHRHRRLVLSRLLNAGVPLGVDDLAGYVVRREHPAHRSADEDERRVRTIVGLRHTHLPLLAELGFIEYDRGRAEERVTSNPLAAVAEEYIHRAAQDEHFRLADRS